MQVKKIRVSRSASPFIMKACTSLIPCQIMNVALNYADPSNPIGVPKSRYEGRLTGKEIIGKKAITLDPHLFCCAHLHVLQQMPIVSEYLDEHNEVFLRDNPGHNELWLANEHMKKFIGWSRGFLNHRILKQVNT
jgi:hypothetical protein